MATATEAQTKKPLDDSDISGLFQHRVSLDLTPENARFTRSGGGLISLEVTQPDGRVEFFERIIPIRAFPISSPEHHIAICEPDSQHGGRGDEIGMIETLDIFPAEVAGMIRHELERRYFTPTIHKIHSFHEKFGYCYWDVTTSAGRVEFIMNNPTSNIRTLEDGRIFMYDIDGNCFTIGNPKALDKHSYKKLEIYL